MSDVVLRSFSARLDCHYLVRAPASMDRIGALVLALHGFGQNPETMLDLSAKLFDAPAVIAALQGPNQFFLGQNNREIGYGWNTSCRPEESIRLHHEMVSYVLAEMGREFAIPPERRLLVGFSQPVSLNYRFAASCPDAIRGVVGICGGLPGNWETGDYQPVKAALLHIARRDDEFYPPAVSEQYAGRLRRRAVDVEFHLLDGGHRMPSTGGLPVNPWLRRILT
jgi:predicted esterase